VAILAPSQSIKPPQMQSPKIGRPVIPPDEW
jgi:hypothetical protein